MSVIEEINSRNLEDINIFISADTLEKRSKLRSFFEKDKRLVCIPFYPDTEQTLSKLAYNYLKNIKISISSENINLIVNKCNGDRKVLLNELSKIENYTKKGAPYGGAEGGHYRKEPANRVYPNRDPRGGMFETK